MKQPEVSIITPVYNGYKFILDSYKSITSQTLPNFEWIIIDDSSTDQTHVLLRKIAGDDKRIRLFRMDRNGGAVKARNMGLKEAQGRFIAFCDIDDLWTPEKLEKQTAFMKEKKAGLSYTSYRKIDLEGRFISNYPMPIPSRLTKHKILKSCSIMASSAMMDTTITGPILQDRNVRVKDDLHLWVNLLDKIKYAYGLKESLALLRIHNDSLTGNKTVEARRQWEFYRDVKKYSLPKSFYYFAHYAVRGLIKYLQ